MPPRTQRSRVFLRPARSQSLMKCYQVRSVCQSVHDQHNRVSHILGVVYFESSSLQNNPVMQKPKVRILLIGTSISSGNNYNITITALTGPIKHFKNKIYIFHRLFYLLFEICHLVSPVGACLYGTVSLLTKGLHFST